MNAGRRYPSRRLALTAAGLTCLLLFAWLVYAVRSSPQRADAQPDVANLPYQPAPAERLSADGSIVIAYHPLAREAGERMFRQGGNAFDAFVAATLAECVLAEGASSLAGSLGALVYDARTRRTLYLDADFNDPIDPAAKWEASSPSAGKAVLAPGAIAGLEAMSKRFGKLRFAQATMPALELAKNGFPLNPLYAGFIVWRRPVLERSEYGRRTFLPGGRPLQAGDRLVQPEVAELLTHLGREGSAWMYSGEWGQQFLETVKNAGGALTADDLKRYTPLWTEPWTTDYRGHRIQTSSSRSYGGVWLLMALNIASHTTMSSGRAWESVDALERDLRIARQVWSQLWIVDYRALDDRELVARRLRPHEALPLWKQIEAQLSGERAPPQRGSHSYQIVTADGEGNVVSGTHTINAEPWGEGLFVQGVPLTSGGMIPWQTRPGERRLGGFTNFFVWGEGRIQYAGGTISNSLAEAAFQLVVNLVDHALPVERAVSVPRFGTFPMDASASELTFAFDTNWVDPRIDPSFVRKLAQRGLQLRQSGLVDTGLGAVLDARGPTLAGAVAPVPYVASAFATPARASSRSRACCRSLYRAIASIDDIHSVFRSGPLSLAPVTSISEIDLSLPGVSRPSGSIGLLESRTKSEIARVLRDEVEPPATSRVVVYRGPTSFPGFRSSRYTVKLAGLREATSKASCAVPSRSRLLKP
jgi:gamma-glutamyltranspeptidase/glutathione hydrolase